MRILVGVCLCAVMLAAKLPAITIQSQATNLGNHEVQFTYEVSGVDFLANQEFDIHFDPALYGTLSDGVAGSGFDLLLLQPNNPPGVYGDYSALASGNHPSLAGPFSVDAVYLGSGTPGPQPFFEFGSDGVSTIASGLTTPIALTAVPEPGTLWLFGLGVLLSIAVRAIWRWIENKSLAAGY